MGKKELAIVLGITANMTFALANVLMGIKKYLQNRYFDMVVYNKDVSDKEKQLLNSIIPCKFIDYDIEPSDISLHSLNRYSVLTYSRYECFELLHDYKKVLWLDIDVLVQRNLTDIIDIQTNGAAFWKNDLHKNQFNFTVKLDDFDMETNYYNAGIFVLEDNLASHEKMRDWCYQKTKELGKFLVCGDQGIMNIVLQHFNVPVIPLDECFNCHPEKQIAENAVILHPYAEEKFWNYYNFSEWNENYRQWLQMGGSPYKGKKYNYFDKTWIKLKKKYMPAAPDFRRHTGKFIKYFYEYNFKKA